MKLSIMYFEMYLPIHLPKCDPSTLQIPTSRNAMLRLSRSKNMKCDIFSKFIIMWPILNFLLAKKCGNIQSHLLLPLFYETPAWKIRVSRVVYYIIKVVSILDLLQWYIAIKHKCWWITIHVRGYNLSCVM